MTRPSKYTQELKNQIAGYIADDLTIRDVCFGASFQLSTPDRIMSCYASHFAGRRLGKVRASSTFLSLPTATEPTVLIFSHHK